MASSKSYERIEARDDGYLWVVDYEEKEQQPLLLHAASNLLKQLKEEWHKDVVFSDNDGDDDDEEVVVVEKAEEKQGNKEGDNDDGNEDEEEPSESNKHDETNPNTTSEKDESLVNYESLERTLNLGDRIITTLTHIRLYKHDKRKKKRQHQSNRESKVKALQHQRDRLQLQKEQQQQQQPEVKIEEKPSHDGEEEDFQVVVKRKDSKKDGEQQDEDFEPQDPHIRLVRTLNSIRALAPILRQVLFHPNRKSHTIRCGPKKIQLQAGGKRTKSWLLGNYVFDIASAGAVNNMQSNLQEILEFYLPDQLVAGLIVDTMDPKEEFWNREWLVRTWPSPEKANSIHLESPYKILAEFVTEESPNQEVLDKIRKQCQACDNQFFPKEPSDGGKAKAEHNRYKQAVDKLHKTLSRILEKDFPGARLSIYGSCLSNLSLKASDVDLSLFLPQAQKAKKSFQNGFWEPARYEKEMTKLVRDVFRRLIRRKGEFKDMVPVTRARVPVVKGCYMNANNPYTADGSLHFDICFLNDIAVANSNLLREYSWFDESVRELMVVVKKWAKDNKICSAQDNSISSYAWLNMVIFYLQCSGYIPNLQSQELLQQYGLTRNPTEYWHNVNDLDTCYLTLEQANQVWKRPDHYEKEPISNTALLYGFFNFYAISFVRTVSMISIKRGNEDVLPKTVFRKCSPFFCIEDPFETYDSHMPHDLGIPVNETQTKRIFQLLREAEEHLRVHLLGQDEGEDEDAESSFTSLWPWPPSQPERTNVNGEKNSAGRRRGGRGKEGGRNRNNKKDEGKGGQKQQKKEQPKPDSKASPNKINTDQVDSSKQKPKNAGEQDKGVKKSPPTTNPSDKNDNKGKKKTQEAGQSPAEAGGDGSKKTDKSQSKDIKKDGNRSPRHSGGRGRGRGGGHKKSDKSHQSEEKKDGDNHSSDGQGRGNNKNSGGRGGRGRGGHGRGGRGGRGRGGRGGSGSGGRGGGGDKKAKGESSGN